MAPSAVPICKKTELKTVRKQVKELIKKHGYKPSEIFPALNTTNKPKTKVPPKYRNPKDAEQTWTGRGRKPNWVIEFLKSGKNNLKSVEIS